MFWSCYNGFKYSSIPHIDLVGFSVFLSIGGFLWLIPDFKNIIWASVLKKKKICPAYELRELSDRLLPKIHFSLITSESPSRTQGLEMASSLGWLWLASWPTLSAFTDNCPLWGSYRVSQGLRHTHSEVLETVAVMQRKEVLILKIYLEVFVSCAGNVT